MCPEAWEAQGVNISLSLEEAVLSDSLTVSVITVISVIIVISVISLSVIRVFIVTRFSVPSVPRVSSLLLLSLGTFNSNK